MRTSIKNSLAKNSLAQTTSQSEIKDGNTESLVLAQYTKTDNIVEEVNIL